MNFNRLIKKNYQILIEPEADSLDTAFSRECKLREKFNKECIQMVETICNDGSKMILLPEQYSIKSIITEVICAYLTSYRTNRINILTAAKYLIRVLTLLKLTNKKSAAKFEESLFVFLSKVYLCFFSIKSLMLNMARIFFKLEYIEKSSNEEQKNKYLLCINFPRYAFFKQNITRTNKQSGDLEKCLSFANYLCSTGDVEESSIVSIGEYTQEFWASSSEAHLENILEHYMTCRKLASPLIVYQQIIEQLKNIKIVFKLFSSLNPGDFVNKVFIFFGLLNYFTQFAEVFGFVKGMSKNKSVKLIINANSFYVFPWYAHLIADKSHYMYADNCCYFPFAYFSPSKDLKYNPVLNESDALMYGLLEWPLYYRVVGLSDIGYQGVARLSKSLSMTNSTVTIDREENISIPLQIGSMKSIGNSSHNENGLLRTEHSKKKTVLFLDSKTIYPEQQYSSIDVPNVFYTPEVSEHYYRSFVDVANNNNVSILIKPKYVVSKILLSVIEQMSAKNTSSESEVTVVPPLDSLQETIISINPDILLIRPMSSTYLFVESLGFEPHYYIPDSIINIFENMKNNLNSSEFMKDNWLNEQGLLNMLNA